MCMAKISAILDIYMYMLPKSSWSLVFVIFFIWSFIGVVWWDHPQLSLIFYCWFVLHCVQCAVYNKMVLVLIRWNVLSSATPPPTFSSSTTSEKPEGPSSGARTSKLTQSELWGIIGGCIAFFLVVIIIIVVSCICCRKKKSGGASKG